MGWGLLAGASWGGGDEVEGQGRGCEYGALLGSEVEEHGGIG